ncbi:hypothetical protein JCM3770_000473, partial [Rhodotorula araucariae]
MPLTALYRQVQPPSGAHLALACSLVPARDDPARELTGHLLCANNNCIHVYAVTRTHTLVHLASRSLHGRVSSLARVRTLQSAADAKDRILVGFTDAKMSLMEWSQHAHDLVPVSLHTFEKLPQVADDRPSLLAVDPASRLAALLLPTNSGGDATLALLPFFADDLDLDTIGIDRDAWQGGSIPYAPSHLVPLAALTSSSLASTASNAFLPGAAQPPVRNVVSMAFLPGFTEPTLALLYAPEWTWSGRLEHLAHNYLVSLVTLTTASGAAAASTRATVISTSPPLPYSCLQLTACPPHIGGVVVTTANGLLHVDQSGRVVACPANAWLARDYPPGRARPPGLDAPPPPPQQQPAGVRDALDGARLAWLSHPADSDSDSDADADADADTESALLDPSTSASASAGDATALVVTRSGRALVLSVTLTGRAVSALHLAPIADLGAVTGAGAGAAALVRISGSAGARDRHGGLVFVGSETGAGALVRWRWEYDVDDDDAAATVGAAG